MERRKATQFFSKALKARVAHVSLFKNPNTLAFKGAAMLYFTDDNEALKADKIEIPFKGKEKQTKKNITKMAKCYKPKNE